MELDSYNEYNSEDQEVNILHISDLHFGCGGRSAKLFNKQRRKLINSLIEKLCNYHDDFGRWKPDIVVVSGDLAYHGKSDEYKLYKEDFYEAVKRGFNIEDDCIVVCPGNHDVIRKNKIIGRTSTGAPICYPRPADRGTKIGDELDELQNVNEEKINREQIGDNVRRPRARHFKDYIIECCNNDPQSIVRLHIPKKWPWIHFAVLNSAWDCQDDYDEGKLRVGLDFLSEILYASDESGIKKAIICAVFHHPHMEIDINDGRGGKRICNWLASSEQYPTMHGEDCFVKRLNESVKCIMNGHIHEQRKPEYLGKCNRHNGFWSICGTLIANDTPLYHCRVIKIHRSGSLSYTDLSSSMAETRFEWDTSSHYGSYDDEFLSVISKSIKDKTIAPYIYQLIKIVSSHMHNSDYKWEYNVSHLNDDYLSDEHDNVLVKKKG